MASVDVVLEEHNNDFYRIFQPRFIFVLMGAMVVAMVWTGIVLFQVYHRPLPTFYAVQPKGQRLMLQPEDLPNLSSNTILQFASKAVVAAYTFDFVNYKNEISAAHVYFTTAGWNDYIASVSPVVRGIAQNKLFVAGVVNGAPIISNQGDIGGEYFWRVQIPFLVTYQSAQSSEQKKFTVQITIARIPTNISPLGIGVDQFLMS